MTLFSQAPRHLIDFLVEQGIRPPELCLIDVGVSGGVYPLWRRWDKALSGIGIDAIVDEVERLAQHETNPRMKYVGARVASADPNEQPSRTDYTLHRSQAYLATVALQRKIPANGTAFRSLWKETLCSPKAPIEANFSNVPHPETDPFYGYYQRKFGRNETPRLSERRSTLDDLVHEVGLEMPPDVLKIDTDGYDFSVLQGARKTLATCLAVEIEIQFQGLVSPKANVFCNIDAILRHEGFTLCKLVPAHYARSALPRPFSYDIPAQNDVGRIVWADALYIRDIADPRYEEQHGFFATHDQRQNLALILDLYGLEDSAAEIILATSGLFDGNHDEGALDFLCRKLYGPSSSYEKLVTGFINDPLGFPRR